MTSINKLKSSVIKYAPVIFSSGSVTEEQWHGLSELCVESYRIGWDDKGDSVLKSIDEMKTKLEVIG